LLGTDAATHATRGAVRVAVASDGHLVADAIAAALRARGYETDVIRWPAPRPAGEKQRRPTSPRAGGRPRPEVALLLSDLDRIGRVRSARRLIDGLAVPWLVLTDEPRGPAWGALYESGATLVAAPESSLSDTCALLDRLAAGDSPSRRRGREALIRAWRSYVQQRMDMTMRLETLTAREREVLRGLHSGLTVREIADLDEVTQSTVRSQVKAILHKLDVGSQLAAVAMYEELLSESTREIEEILPSDV
jgi:DNA-binding NarL/FixJ family response regulator